MSRPRHSGRLAPWDREVLRGTGHRRSGNSAIPIQTIINVKSTAGVFLSCLTVGQRCWPNGIRGTPWIVPRYGEPQEQGVPRLQQFVGARRTRELSTQETVQGQETLRSG